jgi:hypothetical protein
VAEAADLSERVGFADFLFEAALEKHGVQELSKELGRALERRVVLLLGGHFEDLRRET